MICRPFGSRAVAHWTNILLNFDVREKVNVESFCYFRSANFCVASCAASPAGFPS